MSAWLIDTVLYTGALIALVLVLRRPVGRFFGPQIAYALWALPLLRLLMPPIVLPASFAPEPAAAPAGVLSAEWGVAPTEAPTQALVPDGAAWAVAQRPAWEWADLVAPMVSIWAGVAIAFLAWRIVTYRRMRREVLAEARPVGEVGRIHLMETPAVAAPVAFGVTDKVIALPPLFMAQHDVAARDLAIAHELAHHQGHDLLANMAAQALLALHWFNPLAWYGWRAMRRDQEAACDARVLAGRGSEERLCYAALIARVATGPRPVAFEAALAAPMACPVLGERSIVHRLRSISMSEPSRRRRWLGRGLVAASALVLPLTASISYASAHVSPPSAGELPSAIPEGDSRPDVRDDEIRVFVLGREDGQGEPGPHQFALGGDGDAPRPPRVLQQSQPLQPPQRPQPPQPAHPLQPPQPMQPPELPQPPQFQFDGFADGHPSDPEWQARMEEFGRAMEKWGEEFGQKFAKQAEARAQAWAEAGRHMPEIVESCDESERGRTVTAEGRPRVVICKREIELAARSGLLQARSSIAGNRQLSEDVRREVLRDLDEELERIERGE